MRRGEQFKPGAVIEVGYPFVRGTWANPEEEPLNTWQPGTRRSDDSRRVREADAMGTMILTVVDVHTPGTFPTRVFFTRMWRDPDGAEFGPKYRKLHVKTIGQFRRLIHGYRHDFDLPGSDIDRTSPPTAALEVSGG